MDELKQSLTDFNEKIRGIIKEMNEKYREKRMEVISSNFKEVLIIIRDNLADGIVGEIDENDISITLKKEEKIKKKKEETKIYTEIGKVMYMNSGQNKFKVTLYGKNIENHEEDFELDSLGKIHDIAKFINANVS